MMLPKFAARKSVRLLLKTGQSSRRSREKSRPKAGTPAADPGNFVGNFLFSCWLLPRYVQSSCILGCRRKRTSTLGKPGGWTLDSKLAPRSGCVVVRRHRDLVRRKTPPPACPPLPLGSLLRTRTACPAHGADASPCISGPLPLPL
jgi:hypothetical protein